MNSLTFNFVVSWFVVKPKLVCLNMYSFPANWTKKQNLVLLDSTSILRAQITLNNQFDYVLEYDWWDYIIFFKLKSTIRPVLLYKSASKLSHLYVRVQHNVHSVLITRYGVASCMPSYTWHRYTYNRVINLFVQTPTNNHTSPSPFQCLYVDIYLNYHDNYFVCSINHTLSEWLYSMPEMKSFGVRAILIEMRFVLKN